MSYVNKLTAVLQRMASAYRQDSVFSKSLARTNLLRTAAGYSRLSGLSQKMSDKKDKIVFSVLSEIVWPVVEEYRECRERGEVVKNQPVWVLWWTGKDNAPELVQRCIASIQKQSAKHPDIVLDKNNIGDYIEIPGYMIDRVEKKQICLANFSDYIRYALLNKYGGMWIDATILLSKNIPEQYFDLPLFTCNASGPTEYVSNGKWATFVFGGRKGHTLFQFMQKAIEEYWYRKESSIDYLYADYLMRLAYDNIPIVKQDIDAIPINNLHRNDLRGAMNRAEPAEKYDEFLFSDTCFNKLSWREQYNIRDEQGNKTVYSEFLDRKNE